MFLDLSVATAWQDALNLLYFQMRYNVLDNKFSHSYSFHGVIFTIDLFKNK